MGCGNSVPESTTNTQQNSLAKQKLELYRDYEKALKDFGHVFAQLSYKGKPCFIGLGGSDKGLEICLFFGNEIWSAFEYDLPQQKPQKDWSVFFLSIKNNVRKSTIKEGNQGELYLLIPKGGVVGNHFKLRNEKDIHAMNRILIVPLMNFYIAQKQNSDDSGFVRMEVEIIKRKILIHDCDQKSISIQAEIEPLDKSARQVQEDARAAKEECDMLRRKIRKMTQRLKQNQEMNDLYPDAPDLYLLHTFHAKEHVPKITPCNYNVMHSIKEKYGGSTSLQGLTPNFNNPNTGNHTEIAKALLKIDDWDFDVFELDKITNGGALFISAYCLLYKCGLVKHFNLDDEILINFLQAVQSGYHPNAYHNAVHAADVLQITHYIVEPGGLRQHIGMTPNDVLAALLAAAIHDYDHPGFNNHFHNRTQSYLATLYNDRSVLENHHLAQLFELMKNPKYNIFSVLSYDAYKDIRETMVEMVLSTDMGSHAKIYHNFCQRLGETKKDWVAKEDHRLFLSIAIKMADISNCCRPPRIYAEWAKRIGAEFYNQGDVEARIGLSVSPFMDRRKGKSDFPKGQVSFMNYIAIPLFEAGVALLPKLDFTIRLINSNKSDWLNQKQ